MEVVGMHGRSLRVSFHRRRRRLIPGLSTAAGISTVAVLLVLLLALMSLLAPPLLDDPSLPAQHGHGSGMRRYNAPLLVEGRIGIERNSLEEGIFQVPKGGGSLAHNLWKSELSKNYHGCSKSSSKFQSAEAITYSNRYLMIATSGGLNQQRTGITDAVVVARILNATLVVPQLDQKSFWKDSSDFSEIFDVDWFISSLSKDVKIIKELPRNGEKAVDIPYTMRVPRKCTPKCYQNRVLPVLLRRHVVQLTKFDFRLANKLATDLQKLRCRVNYHSLKFANPIQAMGDTLIQRMKMKSKHFIALHLRFEPDMLAFSGCYYGGGDKERKELGSMRRRWKTLHESNPDKERRHGKCPLTPEEVGLMLRALGFGSDVHIYVASGEVYGGEETLAPLKMLFPNFHSKETLARKEELAPFLPFSSRLAALDFIVCDASDAFVTNNNGNMARILAGRRRFFGHKRTIRPNTKKLYSLFLNRTKLTWEAFASKVRTHQKGFMGEPNEVRPGRGEFHENPSNCICEKTESSPRQSEKHGDSEKQQQPNLAGNEPEYGHLNDEESDWFNMDYRENQPPGKRPSGSGGGGSDYDLLTKPDEVELEERFSD